jgi:hypothetical protein
MCRNYFPTYVPSCTLLSKPQHLTQGAEDSVRGLMTWFAVETDMHVRAKLIAYMDLLILLVHPKVIPSLVGAAPTFLNSLLDGIAEDIYRWHRRTPNAVALDRDTYAAMFAASRFLSHALSNLNPTQQTAFFRPCARELLDWCDKSVALVARLHPLVSHLPGMPRGTLDEAAHGFFSAAVLAFYRFPAIRKERLLTTSIADVGTEIIRSRERSSTLLTEALLALRSRQRCGAPGCPRTFVDQDSSSGSACEPVYRLCAGCRRVPYCSRECQRRAWRGPAPHRDVCGPLRALCSEFRIGRKVRPGEPLRVRHDEPWNGICLAVVGCITELERVELASSGEFAHRPLEKTLTSSYPEYRSQQEWEAERRQLLASKGAPG